MEINGTSGLTFESQSETINGGVPVFASERREMQYFGGKLVSPVAGATIGAGTPIYWNAKTKDITIVKAYEVIEAVTAGTTIKIRKRTDYPIPVVGEFIMADAETVGATGQGFEVTAVSDEDTYIEVTVGAAITAALADVLVDAVDDAADTTVKNVINGFIPEQIYISLANDTSTVISSVCVGCDIYGERIAPCPAYIKSPRYMDNINFVYEKTL